MSDLADFSYSFEHTCQLLKLKEGMENVGLEGTVGAIVFTWMLSIEISKQVSDIHWEF